MTYLISSWVFVWLVIAIDIGWMFSRKGEAEDWEANPLMLMLIESQGMNVAAATRIFLGLIATFIATYIFFVKKKYAHAWLITAIAIFVHLGLLFQYSRLYWW